MRFQLLHVNRPVMISFLLVPAALVALGFGAVLAGPPPTQGAPGTVPATPPHPSVLGETPAAGPIGVQASSNFGTVSADNTCVGNRSPIYCDTDYTPTDDLQVMDGGPTIQMLNGHPSSLLTRFWSLSVDSVNSFTLSDETGSHTTPFQVQNDAPTNSFVLSGAGSLGLGTATPGADLHLVRNGSLRLRLEDTASGGVRTDLFQGVGGLFFENAVGVSPATTPFKVLNGAPSDALDITETGRVGVGTATPITRLQVGPGATGIATAGGSLLVQEGVASAMIMKSTAGPEMFLYEDQNNGLMGTATATPFGLRTANTNRFWMTAGGNVGIGNAFTNPAHLFQVGDANGANTDGTTWNNASSKAIKQSFERTDDQSVLEKLVALPVDSWSYKTEGDGIRHLGPTAEDFKTAFGLGASDRSIATVDADGVALASIKGLYGIVQEKDAKIAGLEKNVAALTSRLEAVERQAPATSTASAAKTVGPGTTAIALVLGSALVAFMALGFVFGQRRRA